MAIIKLVFPEQHRENILSAFKEISGFKSLASTTAVPMRLRQMKAASWVGSEIKVMGAGPNWARIKITQKPFSAPGQIVFPVFNIELNRALGKAGIKPEEIKRTLERG